MVVSGLETKSKFDNHNLVNVYIWEANKLRKFRKFPSRRKVVVKSLMFAVLLPQIHITQI